MGRFSVIFFVFGFVLALSMASASSYNIEFNQVNGKLIVKGSIYLNKTSNFSVNLPEDYNDLYVTGNFSLVERVLSFKDSSAEFVYTTSEGLNRADEGFYFVNKIVYPENFDSVTVRLNLDKGIIVHNSEAYPMGYQIESDGQIISLVWKFGSVKKGEYVPVFVNLEAINGEFNWWTIFAFLIVLIFVAGFAFYYKKIFKKGKNNYEHLLDAEKKVIGELKKADRNELWQKQLQISTDFSKAKLSRLIRNLESRGLIKKVPYGNTNKISLK